MTTLHSGGKFEGTAYKVSGRASWGWALPVSMLFQLFFKLKFDREKEIHFIEIFQGKVKTKLTTIPKSKIERLESILPGGITGTTTTFYPDPEIFKETIEFDNKTIIKSLKDRAYLTSKIYFHFYDDRNHSEHHYFFEGGILSLLRELNKNKKRPS